MIKTYRYNAMANNVSHVLTGKGGNTVRFNFTHGNVLIKKQPELTLQGKYYQDLLEDSDLFKGGRIRLVKTIKEDSDVEEKVVKKTTTTTETKAVADVTSEDELLAYVNETYGKEYVSVSAALKYATAQGVSFPNLQFG